WVYPRATHEIDPESTSGAGGAAGQRYVVRPWFEPGAEARAGISVGTNGVSVYEHGTGYMPATLVHQASINGWTHVAVVYENKQPKLYLNGTLVKTCLTSPRAYVRAGTSGLGGAENDFYAGRLDDVRVYKGAFAPSEVPALAAGMGAGLTAR
ncbi:MAG TPA: LamG-like jellyroll fold domain-containing protein, partial [Pyrinomonadaceae bacterium]